MTDQVFCEGPRWARETSALHSQAMQIKDTCLKVIIKTSQPALCKHTKAVKKINSAGNQSR